MKPWNTSEERENYICEFVTKLIEHSESQTQPARQRWVENAKFFDGEASVSTDREDKDWMSRPNLPEYQAMIRRMAAVIQDLIFEDPDFYEVEADKERGGVEELERPLKNICDFYLKDINFEKGTYLYCLIGGIYGIAISKLTVEARLEYLPEVVIEKVDSIDQQSRASLGKDVAVEDRYAIPDSPDLIEGHLITAMDEIFGESAGRKERKIKPKKRRRLGMKMEFPNPLNIFFDPDVHDINDSPYFIQRGFFHFYNIVDQFDSGAFRKERRQAVKDSMPFHGGSIAGINSSYEEQKIVIQKQLTATEQFMPVGEICEYWGHLYDRDGDILEENKHFVVINRKVLVKDDDNEYFSQQPPYYTSTFSPVPFKAVGNGAADSAKKLNELINDLFASWMDLMRMAVYQPIAFDGSKVDKPEELDTYVQPGKMYDTNGADPKSIFAPIMPNLNVAAPLFQTIEALKMSGEKGAAIDTTSSNPASRARITAAEIQSNVERATQSVLTIGRELDANYVVPTIEKLIAYILQFAFELDVLADLRDMSVISDSEFNLLQNIPRIERYNELRRNYKIKVRGFRARLENQEFLKKINEAVSVLTKMPPDLAAKVDWSELLRQWFRAFGFDADALIRQNTPMDKAKEENALLANNQMLSIGDNDDDAGELPAHYEGLLRAATPAALAHVKAHMQRALAVNGSFPPPPPQVAEMLGLGMEQPASNEQQMMQ